MNQSSSKEQVLSKKHLVFADGNLEKLKGCESQVNPLNTSGNFDEKNHKAEEDYYSSNNSLNESGIEIQEHNRQCLNNLEKSVNSKDESLLGNKEKMQSLRSNRIQLQSLGPDQVLENFNSQKDGYLQINDNKGEFNFIFYFLKFNIRDILY
jgi:hypothetical protein